MNSGFKKANAQNSKKKEAQLLAALPASPPGKS
jgi:hypothetical protein